MRGLSRLLVRAAAGSHLPCFTEAQRACRLQRRRAAGALRSAVRALVSCTLLLIPVYAIWLTTASAPHPLPLRFLAQLFRHTV